jgi:SAM-dependent methyltransferase
VRLSRRRGTGAALIPSPNIWNWPDVYERENAAQDPDGALWTALREEAPWAGRDVLDVGCGDGFHLPLFAAQAASVTGVEPYAPLVERARRRVRDRARVLEAGADALPLPDRSVDLVHARTAYFFGPGCGPGLAEAERVLRPGGAIAIIDLDATVPPYGGWMRADIPHYDPHRVERFFAEQGFSLRRVPTVWRFPDRSSLEAVLRIEFSARTADRAVAEVSGSVLPVGYRLHVRRKEIVPRNVGSADDRARA